MFTLSLLSFLACSGSEQTTSETKTEAPVEAKAEVKSTGPDAQALQTKAKGLFGPLPKRCPVLREDTPELVALGKSCTSKRDSASMTPNPVTLVTT